MIENVRFPMIIGDSKTNGSIYIESVDVKMDYIVNIIKNIIPSVISDMHGVLLNNSFVPQYYKFHRHTDRLFVTISTSLHLFKLELKDNVYTFTVTELETLDVIREYELGDLVDCVPTKLLSNMIQTDFEDDTNNINWMMNVLFVIITKRFLI